MKSDRRKYCGVITMLIFYWVVSTLVQLLVGDSVARVNLSEVLATIKEDKAEEIVVMDNEILVKVRDSGKTLVASKETSTSMAEILQREGIDVENKI